MPTDRFVTTITLPWPPTQLNPNWTGKLRDKLRAKKQYKHDCFYSAKEDMPSPPAWVKDGEDVPLTIEFYPPDKRSRDDDNTIGSVKYGRDMVAKALGVDDKHFRPTYKFCEPVKGGKVIVRV